MTMVCIYHIDTLEKKHLIESSKPYHLKSVVGLFSFCQNLLGRNTADFGAFLKTFPGPGPGGGNRWSVARRNCLQLKHQVADLERETVRAREERKEELTSVRKRMERHGDHWFIKSGCGSSKFITPLLSHLVCLLSYWSMIWHLGSSKKQRFHCLSPLVAAY